MITKNDIINYFTAEKQESFLFIIVGGLSVALAFAGWFYCKTEAWKGAAIPLLIIGLLPLVVGFTVYSRSDHQSSEAVALLQESPAALVGAELPRMKAVNKNFILYRWLEIAFIVISIGLVIVFNTSNPFWKGFGIALFILSVILLAADYFAEKRAHLYTKQLMDTR